MLIGVTCSFSSDREPVIKLLKSEYKFKDGETEFKEWIKQQNMTIGMTELKEWIKKCEADNETIGVTELKEWIKQCEAKNKIIEAAKVIEWINQHEAENNTIGETKLKEWIEQCEAENKTIGETKLKEWIKQCEAGNKAIGMTELKEWIKQYEAVNKTIGVTELKEWIKQYKAKNKTIGETELKEWIEQCEAENKIIGVTELKEWIKQCEAENKIFGEIKLKKLCEDENKTTGKYPKQRLGMIKSKFTENYVIRIDGLDGLEELKEYRKSPLFLLLAVDNKMTDKYENWEKGDGNENFKEFMKQNDKWWENDDNCKLMSHSREIERCPISKLYSTLYVLNCENISSDELNEKIEKLKSEEVRNQKIEASQLFKPSNFRLSKKYYFMYLAELVASRTNCMSRKVGCVLVKDEYRVIATGYNGTPKGTKNWIEGNCKSCKGEDKNYCKCIHAEENALMIAGMEAEGCTLYVLRFVSTPCLEAIKEANRKANKKRKNEDNIEANDEEANRRANKKAKNEAKNEDNVEANDEANNETNVEANSEFNVCGPKINLIKFKTPVVTIV
ncbi:hypothetical protein C2G38_2193530 [Gigaspora rosea]|uniref:dCMP deaminase n=1 Tax=Gigaspora rosea TaxID=44941 RepID=A0A397V6S0_9GLOM|nr:hypothetical protein C2G38_2193530 [Gigaspora rosea]